MFHSPPAQKRTQANSASPTRSPIRTRSVARAQQVQPAAPTEQELNSRHSHKSKSSHTSHMSVERRKLELKLAQKKAAIERDYKLQLAELELAESIADLDEEARSHRTVDSSEKVTNWIDYSIDANAQPPDDDNGLQQNETVNYVTAVQALKQEDFLRSPELMTAAISKCPSTLITKWADYYALLPAGINKPKIELLSDFLHDEAKKTAAAGISNIFGQADCKKRSDERKPYNAQICHTSDSESAEQQTDKCKYCHKGKHTLISCLRFKKALRRDRWYFVRRQRLCYKCLVGYHRHDTCPATECDIDDCNQPHHRMLHWPIDKVKKHTDNDDEKSEMVAHAVSEKLPKLLLKVVPIMIHGPKRSVKTHALLDDGAAFSLMSADVAKEAGLEGTTQTINAKSAWSSSKITCDVEIVNCDISNTENERFNMRTRVMKELELCTQELSYADIKGHSHLRHHEHVVSYCGGVKPKVLIGHDHYHLIAPLEKKNRLTVRVKGFIRLVRAWLDKISEQ
ncbi:reverse transcriptase [Operophtera brumata]|uniref:Reverse transcriptase n=1 Tax=Operophtera brumata TaxID=104452 RepID=A0A0L7L7P4_OPEBR|nr:reverse transcriptase [Operophtera brumata]